MQCTCQTCVDPDYIITAFIEIVEYEEIFHIFCRIFPQKSSGLRTFAKLLRHPRTSFLLQLLPDTIKTSYSRIVESIGIMGPDTR